MIGNLEEPDKSIFAALETAKHPAHDSAGQTNGRIRKRKKIKTENKLQRVGAKVRRD